MKASKPKPKAEVAKVGEVYPRYFQKSRGFLFPALGLPKSLPFQPHCTYLFRDNLHNREPYLHVVYNHKADDEDFTSFVADKLIVHPDYVDMDFSPDQSQLVLTFRLNEYENDYKLFLQGKYSQLSPKLKARIAEYYGVTSALYAFVHTYLYPEQNYEHYAQLLNVHAEQLRANVELCSIYDEGKEILTFAEENLHVVV